MKARRIIALVISLLLVFGVCVALTSCFGGATPPPTVCTSHADNDGDGVCDSKGCSEPVTSTPGNGDGEGETNYFNENDELILYKNGAPTFTFVLGTDALTSSAGAINTLASTLSGLGTSDVLVKRHTDEGQQAVEILFGTVNNRGEEYSINKYSLGEAGYMVKQIGTKIVVLGGSSEALDVAIDYLKTTVFGIERSNEPFTDFVMASDLNRENIITGYKLTDVKIGENSLRDYTIAYQSGNSTVKSLATDMQKKLYTNAGIWLPLKSNSGEPIADTLSVVIRVVENDAEKNGEAGFEIYIDEDGNLFIETQFENKLADTFGDILDKKILKTRGVYTFTEQSIDVRNVYYSDFGADITGQSNAIDGIVACHEYANRYGHTVNAVKPGQTDVTFRINATYDASTRRVKRAIIKTDVNWTGAHFIIDDSQLSADGPERETHIFEIRAHEKKATYRPSEIADQGTVQQILAEINAAGGINKDTFNTELSLNLGRGRRALVFLYNSNHKNYIRYGPVIANSGNDQMEFVLVDENGNVDPKTPLLFDFDEITKVEVVYVDDAPLTITGGTMTTIANRMPREYTYNYRGIGIYRSNVTLDGLAHYVEGEGEDGAPYRGFFEIKETNNVRIQNCILTGHKTYELEGYEGVNSMGSYDISPASSNNTYFYNVTQTNFFVDDPRSPGNRVPSVGNGYWGIMGGNDCKNVTYDTCQLTRFDSHRGTVNVTIIHSDVALVAIIGGGTFRMEDTRVHMMDMRTSYLVTLRVDYGSTWNGDFIFKDVTAVMHHAFRGNAVALIDGTWKVYEYDSHDFGYDCYMPHTVTADNITVTSKLVRRILLAQGGITAPNNNKTINPYYVTKNFIVRNNHAGLTYNKVIQSVKMTEEPLGGDEQDNG